MDKPTKCTFCSSFFLQVQFIAIVVHAFQLLFIDCNYPKAFVWWIGCHGVLFFCLFSDFYKRSYKNAKSRVSYPYLIFRSSCLYSSTCPIRPQMKSGKWAAVLASSRSDNEKKKIAAWSSFFSFPKSAWKKGRKTWWNILPTLLQFTLPHVSLRPLILPPFSVCPLCLSLGVVLPSEPTLYRARLPIIH